MIDTLFINIQTVECSTAELTSIKNEIDEDGVPLTTKGNLDNLKVAIDHRMHETHIRGSIRSYYHGKCALDDLTYDEFLIAMDRIRRKLDLPFKVFNEAQIIRIDVGMTIMVGRPVKDYLESIFERAKLRIDTFAKETLQFSGTAKKIIFYN